MNTLLEILPVILASGAVGMCWSLHRRVLELEARNARLSAAASRLLIDLEKLKDPKSIKPTSLVHSIQANTEAML